MNRRSLSSKPAMACRLLMLLAALAVWAAPVAWGQLPYHERVPAGAMVAIGIPNTAEFWTKIDALPLSAGIKQYLQSPAVTGDLNYKQFDLQRKKLEKTLGYPLTADQFMKNIFKNGLIYVVPAAGGKGEPSGIALFGVKDGEKAAKLMGALDSKLKALAEGAPAADAGTTASLAAPAPTPNPEFGFEKVTVGNAQVSHFFNKQKQGEAEGFYTLADGLFIFATNQAAMTGALAKEAKAPQTLADTPAFQKMTGLLPWDKSDFMGWIDSDAIVKAAGGMAMMMGKMGAKNNQVAFTFQVQADGLLGKMASAANPIWLPAGSKAEPLLGLSAIAPNPLFAWVGGNMDPDKAFAMLNAQFAQAGAQPGQTPLAGFERETGISVQQELVPALGHEVAFAINSLQMNPNAMPPIPTADLVLGLSVRDMAKMKGIMTKLEKKIEALGAQMAPPSADPNNPQAEAAGPKFQTLANAPVPARTINLKIDGISPSYAFLKSYVLISLNKEGLTRALSRAAGKEPALDKAPSYVALKGMLGSDPAYDFGTLSVKSLVEQVVTPLLPFFSAQMKPEQQQQVTQILFQVLPHLTTATGIDTRKDEFSVGYMKVQMQ